MRTFRPRSLALALGLGLTWIPAGAAAVDFVGTPGKVRMLDVNSTSADTYLAYHGKVGIKPGSGDMETYTWGGTQCPAKTISAEMVALLMDAFMTRKTTLPRWLDGAGNNKCLVGFAISVP